MANLNLNTFPYYDDFDGAKGFHRVLFKPGYAVQARELTQLQTILQEQIKRFGNHVFKDGSVVYGCAESSNFNVPFVTVLDTNSLGGAISNDTFALFEGAVLEGRNHGVQALVKKVATGSVADSPNLKTFYLQYTKTGNDNVTSTFGTGEVLEIVGSSDVTFVVDTIGEGSLFSVGEGIVYAKGAFIVSKPQVVVVDRYTSTPTKKVGFIVRENIITSEDDLTLLDPAQGSFNFSAPGADRYELTTQLIALDSVDSLEGFYILFELQDGQIKRKFNTTQYAELSKTLARRTFDESGDYSVRAFPIIVREHLDNGTNNGRYTSAQGGDASKLVVAVEPGKAYVKGYEYELFATEYLDTPKGFATGSQQNQSVTTGYGNYVILSASAGVWPINGYSTVDLKNTGGTVIGTARVRDIEVVSSSEYKLFLYDIAMTGDVFANVKSIAYAAGNAVGTINTSLTGGIAALQRSSENCAIFESPYSNLSSISDSSFVYRKVISVASVSGATFNLSLGSPDSWAFSTADINDIIVANSSGTYLTVTSGVVSGNTLTITLSAPYAGTATVMAKVRKTISANGKTLAKNRIVKLDTSSNAGGLTGPYSLGVYDVLAIQSVYAADVTVPTYPADPSVDANWTDVTSNFVLDNGQRDTLYDHARITPIVAFTGNKKLIVKFTYFQHGTSSGYYTVDSYPKPTVTASGAAPLNAASEINWYDIPVYTSKGGKNYDLRNCIDFRPTVSPTATDSTTVSGATTNPAAGSSLLSGFTHPSPSEEFIADLTYHLPRVDRVVLDSEGVFNVIQGLPSLEPVKPRQPENAMTLGFVNIAPYPSLPQSVAKDVGKLQYACRVSVVDNRRFTMRDIGEIHKRIDRLEYYTSLSLLEQNTANLLIMNSAGEDRFKNGILVDSFVGHNIGNVFDATYNCSIADGELRPAYRVENIEFDVKSMAHMTKTGNLITLPYTHVVYAQNPHASKTRNAVSQLLFTYNGQLKLTPAADVWADTSKLPDVQVNVGGTADNWETLERAWGTQWGSWETFWQGTSNSTDVTVSQTGNIQTVKTDVIETNTQRQQRVGTGISVDTRSVTTDFGSRVVSAALTPFMRSTVVTFSGSRLKPNTRVYAYFDGVDVSQHCRPINGDIGDALVVDQNGEISGQFRIPANTFTVGTKPFVLCDSTTSATATDIKTFANASFTASGLSVVERGTIVSTQVPEITFTRQNEVRDISTSRIISSSQTTSVVGGFDPIAQSFFVADNPNGIMLSKMDMYFKTKSETAAVTLQIREMVGGFPGETIVPYSSVTLSPASINVSDDATAATTFTFESPVYLKNDTEYCFVLLPAGNDENYEVWVSELGQNQIGTTQRIDKQPYAGVLFVSANNRTWTAVQSEDIKFTVYRCEFDNSTAGSVTLTNKDIDFLTLVTTDSFSPGDDVVFGDGTTSAARGTIKYINTLDKEAHVLITSGTVVSGNKMTVKSTKLTGTISCATGSTALAGTGSAFTTELAAGDVIVAANGTVIGTIQSVTSSTAAILTATASVTVTAGDVFTTKLATVTLQKKIAHALAPSLSYLDFNNTDVTWTYQMNALVGTDMGSINDLQPVGTTILQDGRAVFSASVNDETLVVTGTATSEISSISPVLDLSKTACLLIENLIDDVDPTSQYISRRVVLDDGQEAEDLRVYLTANIPGNASVKVYTKLLNDTDSTPFDTRPWIQMTENLPVSTSGFKEYFYTLPTGGTTSAAGGRDTNGVYKYSTVYSGFKTFAVKIVMLSDNAASVPIIRDMRAIALMV